MPIMAPNYYLRVDIYAQVSEGSRKKSPDRVTAKSAMSELSSILEKSTVHIVRSVPRTVVCIKCKFVLSNVVSIGDVYADA